MRLARRRRGRLACAGLALVAVAAPAPAVAGWGDGADLVSADYGKLEQGDDTTVFAAISGDGRHVAIQTTARNFFADDDPDPPDRYRAGGVFRFDLETRALAKVADGNLFEESDGSFVRLGASNPSISADGRYVAFATAEALVPADVNDNVDVYVRDMERAIGAPGAFDLVSARDGGDVPASYGPPPPPALPFPGSNPGSDLTRGVAISADGRRVALRTDAPSDLPAAAEVETPAGQVLVRDRQLDTTTLVTRTDPGGEPAGGAVGASLSADGTTVAWTGANAPAQTRFLGGETGGDFLYYLWRRIADGPGAPTRRITGMVDPDDPACPPGAVTTFDPVATGPCYGPLTHPEANRTSIGAQVPALSGDGWTVAFLTGAGPRPVPFTESGLDLFVTEMRPGLSRKQATVELTRDTSIADPAGSPALGGVALAADGRHLAVTTERTRFALPALRLADAPRAVPGPRELYAIDLETRTVTRVARSTSGGDANGDVANGVTLSGDGGRIAFTSIAGNLFYGDANERRDAFVATWQPEAGASGPPPVAVRPAGPAGSVEVDPDRGGRRLRARAKVGRRGRIVLRVRAPGAGGIKAVARARAGRPRRLRTLATAGARARARKPVRMVLRPVRRYRRELRRRGRIWTRIRIGYVPARGARRLTTVVRTSFRQRAGRRGRGRR